MNGPDGWRATYGSLDGLWLHKEFAHLTAGLPHVGNVRIARLDQGEELQHYSELEQTGPGISGDWQVISPYTGQPYMMGCNWSG